MRLKVAARSYIGDRRTVRGQGHRGQMPDGRFRESCLYKTAPINNDLVLAYIGRDVLGIPRSNYALGDI
jgi:hypothetical protein